MESSAKEYVVRNGLAYAYDALRSKERLIGDTTTSYYENYFQQLLEKLGPPGRKWESSIGNSEVESFYLGRVSLGEFRLHTKNRVFSKVPGWEFAPFASVVWSKCCSAPDHASLCSKIDTGIGRQIWEIFLALDVDSQSKIHIDDVCDIIQRVLRENGHEELEQNIKEWFCDEILIDFWSFFTAIVENYAALLKPNIIRALHKLITSEVLLSGNLTKKGHKIHSWKERWFTLQPTLLSYYETQETMLLKGTISIGATTEIEYLPDTKGHQRRFRIIDSQTQVPYEICTPDVTSLQQWHNGIQIAAAMNRVSGATNFLHRLTQAQKQVFPENTVFSVNAVTPSGRVTPPSPKDHLSLSPARLVPLAKNGTPQPPSSRRKGGPELLHQSSFPVAARAPQDKILDAPSPVPRQTFNVPPVVPRQKSQKRLLSSREALEKAQRRHSSINYSSEFEREQEREREKLEHVQVGGAMYSVISKPGTNNGRPNVPDKSNSDKEVRRIRPKTPSPSAQRRGYIQLEFQNGTSNLHSAQRAVPPLPKRGFPQTKFSYSTVIFEKEAQQRKEAEREFENGENSAQKKQKPLPPPPPPQDAEGKKNSSSDSNLLTPQPIPRKKPQSLTDIQQQQRTNNNGSSQPPRGIEYTEVNFTAQQPPPRAASSEEEEENRAYSGTPVGNSGRRELPKLPPKQESQARPQPPRTSNLSTPPENGVSSGAAPSRREPPKLPPKQESFDGQQNRRPRPVPRPRVMSPSSEAPPPIPARRSPVQST